jgi:hypothetical protein
VRSGKGNVRISALKQYGLLAGESTGYLASPLAKRIAASPTDELIPLYRQAVLHAAVFRQIFETFHDDTVTRSKLKQRAADLNVHPDETDACVDLYISSLLTAELISVEGEKVLHRSLVDPPNGAAASVANEQSEARVSDTVPEDDGAAESDREEGIDSGEHTRPPRAVFHVMSPSTRA